MCPACAIAELYRFSTLSEVAGGAARCNAGLLFSPAMCDTRFFFLAWRKSLQRKRLAAVNIERMCVCVCVCDKWKQF